LIVNERKEKRDLLPSTMLLSSFSLIMPSEPKKAHGHTMRRRASSFLKNAENSKISCQKEKRPKPKQKT
jgi:hypothetical protein